MCFGGMGYVLMTAPTLRDVERAICCPSGCENEPDDCKAVHFYLEARAVAGLYCEMWKAWQEKK